MTYLGRDKDGGYSFTLTKEKYIGKYRCSARYSLFSSCFVVERGPHSNY